MRQFPKQKALANERKYPNVVELTFPADDWSLNSTVGLGAAMRRRDFVKVVAGSAVTWPLAARAQRPPAAKRLELLRELVPRIGRVAVLVNPDDATRTESTLRDIEAAAHTMGLQIRVFNANTRREIDVAFENIEHERPDALFVATNPFMNVLFNWPNWRRSMVSTSRNFPF
jgi:hypothetical protein